MHGWWSIWKSWNSLLVHWRPSELCNCYCRGGRSVVKFYLVIGLYVQRTYCLYSSYCFCNIDTNMDTARNLYLFFRSIAVANVSILVGYTQLCARVKHKHQHEFDGLKYLLFMYRKLCENAKPRDCTKCRFYCLPQLPLDVIALAGFLGYYSAMVRVSDNIFVNL